MRKEKERNGIIIVALLQFLFILGISALLGDESNLSRNYTQVVHPETMNNFSWQAYPLTFRNVTYSYGLQEAKLPLSYPYLQSAGFLVLDQISGFEYSQQAAETERESSMSLAEAYLRQLAVKKKARRKTSMALGYIGGGVCLAVGGLALNSASQSYGWEGFGEAIAGAMFVTLGAAGVLSGIYSSFPSRAEREVSKMKIISNSIQRQTACREALSSLASKGKKSRLILSAGWVALGIYGLLRPANGVESDSRSGSFFCALPAIYQIFRKTPAEKALEKYLEESKREIEILYEP